MTDTAADRALNTTSEKGEPTMQKRLARVITGTIAACAIWSASAMAETSLSFPSYVWTDKIDGAWMGSLVDDFEAKNPDVKVSRTPIPFSNMADKLFLETTAGQAPDIVTLFDVDVRKYLDADLLEPLDKYLAEAGIRTDEFANAGRQGVKDGHVYAVAWVINPRALFYNKEIFDKLSLTPPRSKEEFLDAARKIKASGLVQFPMATFAKAGDDNVTFIEFGAILAAFDAALFRDGTPTADDPKVLEALSFYKQLFDEGLIPKGLDIGLVRTLFAQGKAAMLVGGPFVSGIVRDADKHVYSNLMSAPYRFSGNSAMSVSIFLGVPKKAKNPDAAAKMLMLMLSDEWQKKVVTGVTSIPLRANILPQDFIHDNPWFAAFQQVGLQARSYAPDGAENLAPEVVKATATNLEAMLFRGKSPEETAKNLQRDLLALKGK